MKRYKYLIVGGGMTADAAVRGIREIDAGGSIGMISAESDPPYKRPPLSKDLWSGDMPLADIDCGTSELDVDILLGRTVTDLNRTEQTVRDDRGDVYHYDRLLLATGGRPQQLPFADDGVIYYRTLQDYRETLQIAGQGKTVAVIGGGFIGCEMAAALTSRDTQVIMVFPEETPGGGTFPPLVGSELAELYQQRGVRLFSGLKPSDLKREDGGFVMMLENGQRLAVDGVIVGIGLEPNVELAEAAGLETTRGGVTVNELLQTTDPLVYAAGDVSCFQSQALQTRRCVEHEDYALTSGRAAGHNMAGSEEPYHHIPLFYSDLFDVGYEAVGELDSSYEYAGVWNGLHGKGVCAFLKEQHVCGVLLWNLFGQGDAARELLQSGPIDSDELNRRLNDILESASEDE